MQRANLGFRLLTLAALGAGSLLLGNDARAGGNGVVRFDALAPGIGGEQLEGERAGPGNEQPTVTTLFADGAPYQLLVYMSSNVAPDEGPWQCKCTSVRLDPTDGPTVVANQVQITSGNPNGAHRPCNHPALASFASGIHPETSGERAGVAVLTYGSDAGSQNVETRAVALNHMCEMISDTVTISENKDVNEGAPDIDHNGDGLFTTGYLSNGEVTHAVGLKVSAGGGSATIEKTFDTNVVQPANIGRPTIVSISPHRSVVCAAKGNQRPPEHGIECGYLDLEKGEVRHRELVAPSEPGEKRFANQPELALLRESSDSGVALLALLYQKSTGPLTNDGGDKDGKGANYSDVIAFSASKDELLVYADAGKTLPLFDTHAGLCAGTSPDPDRRLMAAVVTGPITGIGKTVLHELEYEQGLNRFKLRREVDLAPWGDAGFLANRNGENPGTQGREFYRCLTTPNPFHGGGGFMSGAGAMFLAPFTGHADAEPKNRLSYALVPALLDGEDQGDLPLKHPTCSTTGAGAGAPWRAGWAALLVLGAAFAARTRRRG